MKIFFEKAKSIRETDITYELIPPYAFAHIYFDKNSNELKYEVLEPILDKKEKEALEKIKELIIEFLEVDITELKKEVAIKVISELIEKAVKTLNLKLSKESLEKIKYYVFRDFVGFNEIEPLLSDPYIEDISCSGTKVPIFVVHRVYGSIKTNIVFESEERLKNFIVKLAQRSGRFVTYAEPILEATLPDGSRVSATYSEEISGRGPSFTIRKFTERPFSIIELIELNTLNEEIAAYLWLLIEHKVSALIIGGVGSGKTSLLSALGQFIRPEAKIVSIEDTRELRFVHEHWVPLVTRSGFGLPLLTGEKYGEVTLFDLLKESFRMNPDYVIVGETRGKEIYVMFQGMASGHACLSTFHAESVETLVKRLISPPIELPTGLLEALDLVIVMRRAKEKAEFARRVVEISEISSIDKNTGDVYKNIVYRWNAFEDNFVKENESVKLTKISEKYGISLERLKEELEKRKKVIEWMRKNNIKEYEKVAEIIKMYYKDKKLVDEMIEGKKEYEEARKELLIKEAKELAELLGYRIIEVK
ncbi:MAG: type II/IV secretion system ATPase subunit [Candidatus Aenigmatarchaeota archaeon]